MMSETSEALAAWAASDAPTIQPDAKVIQGSAASRAAALEMLLDAAEDPSEVVAVEKAATSGRPSLSTRGPSGASPLWQIRAPHDLDEALRARAAAEGRTFSEVLRDAASQYLDAHAS